MSRYPTVIIRVIVNSWSATTAGAVLELHVCFDKRFVSKAIELGKADARIAIRGSSSIPWMTPYNGNLDPHSLTITGAVDRSSNGSIAHMVRTTPKAFVANTSSPRPRRRDQPGWLSTGCGTNMLQSWHASHTVEHHGRRTTPHLCP